MASRIQTSLNVYWTFWRTLGRLTCWWDHFLRSHERIKKKILKFISSLCLMCLVNLKLSASLLPSLFVCFLQQHGLSVCRVYKVETRYLKVLLALDILHTCLLYNLRFVCRRWMQNTIESELVASLVMKPQVWIHSCLLLKHPISLI